VADIKLSCSNCGQHISCDEAWAGHQIQCPACQQTIEVARAQPTASAPAQQSKSLVPEVPPTTRPKLSAGVTQVARSTAPAMPTQQRRTPRPPKTSNPALKYAGIAVVLLVLGIAAAKYVPVLLNETGETGTSKASSPPSAPGGRAGGPLGAARRRARSQVSGGVITNAAAKATNGSARPH
jgi:hypothetical protein